MLTKKELIEQLKPFHDDAALLVSIEGDVFPLCGVRMEWTSHDGANMVDDPLNAILEVCV